MTETSPTRVVGVRYEPGEGLPQVILKGSGPVAEAILQQRPLYGAPTIVKDEKLLEMLYRLPIDAEIGPDLFHLVAALLTHVFAVEAKTKGDSNA